MKREAVIKKLKKEAIRQGLEFRREESTRHTRIYVGAFWSNLGRHSEIDDVTVKKFFNQFQDVLGKGWWR